MACGVGPGDEVITSPFSFFATVGSIVRLGAKPVFVDIDPETFNLTTERLERAVTPRTKSYNCRFISSDYAPKWTQSTELAARLNIPVIEDAAQAIGAEYRGRRAGSLGKIGCFSFYPSKNLGGAGDGGLLTTNDPEIAETLRTLRSHGAKKKYYHDCVGINSRLDSLQAAILRVKLPHLDRWADARRANAQKYRELFSAAESTSDRTVALPFEPTGGRHVYNQFVIRVRDRDALRAYLQDRGIGTEVYYPVPLHMQNCFKDLGYSEGDFPEAERAAREALSIPVYPELDEAAQKYVVENIASFYRFRSREKVS